MIRAALVALLLANALATGAGAGDWSGYLGIEGRSFLEGKGRDGQGASSTSLVFEPQFHHSWAEGDQSLHFTPFFRHDTLDENRTHFDLRELYWQKVGRRWELSVGLRKIFWGVAESAHLVDILNQTDQVEDPDGEAKLGQPMVRLRLTRNWGYLDLFLLPLFRERTFASRDGRLRTLLPVLAERATYESERGDQHLDWAIRWSHSLGPFDLGLSYFDGTSREPELRPGIDEAGRPVLLPHYPLLRQTGLDAQATLGSWLLKLESIYRHTSAETTLTTVAGFEYTLFDLGGSGIDLGLLAEHLGSDRPGRPEDLFLASRLTFNDVQSTELLLGALMSLESDTLFLNLEGSRRLGSSMRLTVRARAFLDVPDGDPLEALRQDDYLQILLSWYF
jgi:hypothetical protein